VTEADNGGFPLHSTGLSFDNSLPSYQEYTTWKELPSTIIYESTIPLTYVILWSEPKVNPAPRRSHLENCIKGNQSSICQARRKHLRDLGDAIDDEMRLYWANWYSDEEPPKSLKSKTHVFTRVRSRWNYCCCVATQEKIDSMSTKESKLEAHITALRDSMGETLKSLSLLSEEQKR